MRSYITSKLTIHTPLLRLLCSLFLAHFLIFLSLMSHNRYMSWSDVLTMAPTYPPSGPAVEYPSPVSRRPSECYSEVSSSRRGSSAGFVSEMEGKGQWQSIGSESASSKSPLANFGFFKNLTGEKKTTRGECHQHLAGGLELNIIRWTAGEKARPKAGQ